MPDTDSQQYPWYSVVSGPELVQGDILFNCPVFHIPPDAIHSPGDHSIRIDRQHVIIMTQSCDLAIRDDGSCSAQEVMLATIHLKSELTKNRTFGKKDGWNEAKKGRKARYHVLNKCTVEGHELDFILVDLTRVYSLSTENVRQIAEGMGARLRLMPPYREHLSQAFARLFMRVGLPVDIPDFK